MTDTEEVIAALRAQLIREPVQDRSEEIARLQAANENLHHKVKCLECELRGERAKLELLRDELGAGRHGDGVSFASLEQSAANGKSEDSNASEKLKLE